MKVFKDDIVAVTALISDFAEDSVEKRIASTQSLPKIGLALGTERVKKELIPFLRDEVIFDDTRVIMALLEVLPKFGEALGGSSAYVWLLPVLQDLLQHEEEKPRKKAVQKYQQIMSLIELPKCETAVMSSLKKVYAIDFDESKEGFCCAAATILNRLSPPGQLEAVNLYQTMVESPSAVQRKYATMYSRQLVQWLPCAQPAILRIVELIFKAFKQNEQSNAIYTIDTIIELAKIKPTLSLQPYFNLISYQFPWRIRYELIAKVDRLAEAMGRDSFKSFLTYYIKYLNDIEPQIRSIACLKLQDIASYVEADELLAKILPALKNTAKDTHAYVRNSFASSILCLCPLLTKKATSEWILPKFLQLLKDEESEVRLTVFKKSGYICSALGYDSLLQSVVPILNDLMAHENWRIRIDGTKLYYELIVNSPPEYFNEKGIKVFTDFLKDRSYASRKEAIAILAKVLQQYGPPFFEKQVLPKILPMAKSTNYLHRETLLLAIEALTPKMSIEGNRVIFATVMSLAQDPVSNVRMTVCLTLPGIAASLSKEKDAIRKLLKSLKEDTDANVKEFADKALLIL